MEFKKLLLLPLIFILPSCDNRPSSTDTTTGSNGCSNASTTNPYLSTSYDSCDTDDSTMAGLWVLISDYSTINRSVERNKQQRMIMVVTDNNDGTLNALVCNREESLRNYSFSSGANGLTIYDDFADADIELSITNNVMMQGEHISGDNATVQSSSVSAIKIQDNISIGSLTLDYDLNGFSFSEDNLNVSCFTQNKGTTELLSISISFDGESARFFTDVDNNGTTEELSISVFNPTNPNDELEINLDFATSGSEIEGENTGSTSANYLENTNEEVSLEANVIDDNFPSNTANFELAIDL